MVYRHPESRLLLGFAEGAIEQPVAFIVVSHLFFCRGCRLTVSHVDVDRQAAVAPAQFGDITPPLLRALLGHDLCATRWQSLGPGLGYKTLYAERDIRIRLIKAAPGVDVGVHGHAKREYTLVLAGGFTDETGTYALGDFQALDERHRHKPVADAGEPCIALVVSYGRGRFDSWLRSLVGRIMRF